jgi:hypothetical protein
VSGSVQASDQPADNVQLSPAALGEVALTGRVAENVGAGNLTSDQAQQLYGQISSIHSQIVADRQADGGTLSSTDAQAIQHSQNQLRGTARQAENPCTDAIALRRKPASNILTKRRPRARTQTTCSTSLHIAWQPALSGFKSVCRSPGAAGILTHGTHRLGENRKSQHGHQA